MSIAHRWRTEPAPTVAHQAEHALLGALLLAPRMGILCDGLRPTDFASPFHQSVYTEMERMGRFDAVTLYRALQSRRPPIDGWAAFIGDLLGADFCLEEESVESYARIVREASDRRALAEIGAA